LTRYEKSEYSGFENGTPSPLLFLYVDFSEYTNIYIFIRDGNLVGGGGGGYFKGELIGAKKQASN
jgi:hypothetical protein